MALNLNDQNKSHFHWLNHKNNYLFIIEGGQKLRTISIGDEPGKELHSATLTENKTCTSFSWNKDAKVVALVVNKSQIYLWEVANNNFTHFKPNDKTPGSSNNSNTNRKNRIREIDLILWSKISNKLLVCYSTGQLLLTCFETNLLERFIDNSDGVLGKVSFVERSEHLDLFVCVTVLSEILVMTFDGDPKLYIQREDSDIMKVSFSPPSSTSLNKQIDRIKRLGNHSSINKSDGNNGSNSSGINTTSSNGYKTNLKDELSLWLSYKNMHNRILLKRIVLNATSTMLTSSQSDIVFNETSSEQHLIDFHWLDSSHMIVGFSSGLIQLIEVKYTINIQVLEVQVELIRKEILDIRQDVESCKIYNSDCDQSSPSFENRFTAYELKSHNYIELSTGSSNLNYKKAQSSKQAFSLIAMTDYQVFYYELIEYGQSDSRQYAFERIDDLNLAGSLQKIKSKLAHIQWSFDCSMLALQLSNGHILVYRTRLQDYLVVSYGSKAAYLSGKNEITILNYEYESDERKGLIHDTDHEEKSSPVESSSYNALTLNVSLKPSVIAIGPRHLAVALNNRVRFYLTTAKIGAELGKNIDNLPFYEEEYVSIVVSLKLCSRFVAILFDDGRLKLEMIKSLPKNGKPSATKTTKLDNNVDDDTNLDERFFPDPTNLETVTSFVLTEDLFVYCTAECSIYVFCLKDWVIKQTLNYAKQFNRAILKIISNGSGNKFVCVSQAEQQSSTMSDNVHLYELYTNKMLRFVEGDLYRRLFDSQLITDTTEITLIEEGSQQQQQQLVPKLDRIIDAVWDKDGRTVLLIEQNRIHNYIIMDHTLEESETCIEFVATGKKASTHTTLYASHGIISFQTSLGRVINTISESYDDEMKLSGAKQQIQNIVKEFETGDKSESSLLKAQTSIMNLKLEYLKSAMRIYSLTKCKEICEHLMSDEQFNLVSPDGLTIRHREMDLVIWRQLAARSLFTLNLNFALMIFRQHEMLVFARVLNEIIRDVYLENLDSKSSLKTRLVVLLGCYYHE